MFSRILLVEDDDSVRHSLAEALSAEGLEVSAVESAETALSGFAEFRPEVVLSDVRMPGMSGLELLRLIRERSPGVDVVLMTAFDEMSIIATAMRDGAFDFLIKPLDLVDLREVLVRLGKDRAERGRGLSHPQASAGDFIGRDPAMINVFKRIGQVARGKINVLITGETGTGKELVAKAIHQQSEWSAEPFMAVNCAAFPDSLLEAELFGHVRGAFTGAVADRAGRFALAGEGTLFLDEIGETSPRFQAILLRVLEDGSYSKVGSDEVETAATRIIAATNRDLAEASDSGTFRADLYYRLRVAEITLPPLRDRTGDIPELARLFLQQTAEELALPIANVTHAAIRRLTGHDWPGNIRELKHCLKRAVVFGSGVTVGAEDIDLTTANASVQETGFPTLADVQRVHVERALEATRGNRTEAARLMGVSKPTLYRMLDRFGLR